MQASTPFLKIWPTTQKKHYFAKDKVYFALKMRGPDSDKLLDPTYFKFELRQIHYELSTNSSGFSVTTTPIEYEFWGEKFPNIEKSLYDKVGLQTFICPKNTDFFISGDFNSFNYKAIQITLSKWTGSNWKSDDEINQITMNSHADFQILSAYFDFTDFSNPVKSYLQDPYYIGIIKDMTTVITYNVKINEVYDSSNIIFGSQAFSSNYNFYSIEKADLNFDDFFYKSNLFI